MCLAKKKKKKETMSRNRSLSSSHFLVHDVRS
jgi:hypothetical protein